MPQLPLARLRSVLQPIVDLHSGRISGYEALVRGPVGTPWKMPAEIAARARTEGRARDLEAVCRRLALQQGRRWCRGDQRLFLNVDLTWPELPIPTGPDMPAPAQVALEVSERQALLDAPQALSLLQRWRRQGYTLVLDDYGTGHAALGTLLAIQPDLIKVDRFLVEGVHGDERRRRALRALLELAEELGIGVVAEGIESVEELRTLQDMGVLLGQGFLLAVPADEPPENEVPAPPGGWLHPREGSGEAQAQADVQMLFHEALLDSLAEGVYYLDRRRTILRWNRGAQEITGFSADELEGRRCMFSGLGHESLDGRSLCAGSCPLVATLVDGTPRQEVIRMQTKEARILTIALRTIPVFGRRGRVVGVVETFRPVPDQP